MTTVRPNLISHYKAENVTAVCNRAVSPTYCLCLSLPVLDFNFILVRRKVRYIRAMTPRPSVNAFSKSLPYVCRSCVYCQSIAKTGQRRSITREFLRKTAEAEAQWKVQAGEIREGKRDSMLTILEKRGYVNSIAGYAYFRSCV